MTDIVDDMIEYKWYRVDQNVVRFADSRFGRRHDGDYREGELVPIAPRSPNINRSMPMWSQH